MAKFKIKYVKNIFCPKHNSGNDWADPSSLDYELGTNHTEKLNQYQYHSNNIGLLCSDFLDGDQRKYSKSTKFTISEASILLLKHIEYSLKECRKTKKFLATKINTNTNEFYRKVNERELTFNLRQAKIWRKKVRDIKKSPEYLWEQLSK